MGGATFLTSFPVRMVFDVGRHRYSTTGWIRRLTLISLLGSMMLFPMWDYLPCMQQWSTSARQGVASSVLLLSDAIVFPSFYFADSLVQGIIMQRPLPPGHWLDANALTFAFVLLSDGFGNPLGPPLARFRLAAGSQIGYALQQVVLSVI